MVSCGSALLRSTPQCIIQVVHVYVSTARAGGIVAPSLTLHKFDRLILINGCVPKGSQNW